MHSLLKDFLGRTTRVVRIDPLSRSIVAGVIVAVLLCGIDQALARDSITRTGANVIASASIFILAGTILGILGFLPLLLFLRSSPRSPRAAGLILAISGGLLLIIVAPIFSGADRSSSTTLIEALGCFALVLAMSIYLPSQRRIINVVASLALIWLAAFALRRDVRRHVEHALPSTWEQPVHLNRLIRRARDTRQYVAYHWAPKTAAASVVTVATTRALTKRFESHDTQLDSAWREPSNPPATDRAERAAVAASSPSAETSASTSSASPSASALTSLSHPWNIVFFFVDTLRADVALDPTAMPATARWLREHISFSRAYAPGSSTLLTLTPTLSCRYDATPQDPPVLLQLARDHGVETALFIPKVAADYHHALYPAFRFDKEVVTTLDTSAPTADLLVDRSLAWLRNERPNRFLLWLYHHDVHEWADLVAPSPSAQPQKPATTMTLPPLYISAAQGVDRSFARFRAGLKDLGLADRTVIVFLSDHGEALGQQEGFWRHSTHLWESLVRVPLGLEVPGMNKPRSIDTPVSLVDLPTTLSRFISDKEPAARHCHGEDLLATNPPGSAPNRLPILFSAMVEGELARIGLLNAQGDRKLVVDLSDGATHLLQLPQEKEITNADELTPLLNQLVRSPIYPRH